MTGTPLPVPIAAPVQIRAIPSFFSSYGGLAVAERSRHAKIGRFICLYNGLVN
jgi:hypothetical protein